MVWTAPQFVGTRSVTDLRDGSELFRCGCAKAEELKIRRNLLEQHVGTDLNFAAARPCCRQKRRKLLLHDNFADERRGRDSSDVQRQRVVLLHAQRRRIDNNIKAGRIPRADLDLQGGIVSSQTLSQTINYSGVAIKNGNFRSATLAHRSNNR